LNERLLQYLWERQHFNAAGLVTEAGEPLTILYPGLLNTHQGPDFLSARIIIRNECWVGNIELHCKTSHWNAHAHSGDENYRNVILHVVWEDDGFIIPSIPLLTLKERVPKWLLAKHTHWLENKLFVPCATQIAQASAATWPAWLTALAARRLHRKGAQIVNMLEQVNGHWEEIFWWMLARNMGMKVNADAFEHMARRLPEKILAKEKHQPLRIEALLFGLAGCLDEQHDDKYYVMLQNEFRFLRKKYKLVSEPHPLYFLRMRPRNFPTVRLAQLASIVCNCTHLFTTLLGINDLKTARSFFDVTANDYWHYHYRFGETTVYQPKQLGEGMINGIMINTVIPLLAAYADHTNATELKERMVQWLRQMRSEHNAIIAQWTSHGIHSANALESQALLELKATFCDERRCLDCAVGRELMGRPGW
jgi:Protein of unknown function (DUF2851)